MQTNGFQHWIHFIKNIFKNEMDPVFWVLFFSEALGPIPNWILFRFPSLCNISVIKYVVNNSNNGNCIHKGKNLKLFSAKFFNSSVKFDFLVIVHIFFLSGFIGGFNYFHFMSFFQGFLADNSNLS